MEEEAKYTDELGNSIRPEFIGDLPSKMNIQSKKIKLKLEDQYKQMSVVKTSTEDKCNCEDKKYVDD